jgi:hypothetical protein
LFTEKRPFTSMPGCAAACVRGAAVGVAAGGAASVVAPNKRMMLAWMANNSLLMFLVSVRKFRQF